MADLATPGMIGGTQRCVNLDQASAPGQLAIGKMSDVC
jgi:hypothetical protein